MILTPINKNDFVHLHVHSHYSIRGGVSSVEELVAQCRTLRMGAMALTEINHLSSLYNFYQQCKKNRIFPIYGCELEIISPLTNRQSGIVLLCENENGLRNLIQLVSGKTPVLLETLILHKEGLICLSGGLYGPVNQLLDDEEFEKAENLAKQFQDIWGKGNFFLEIMDHGLENEKNSLYGLLGISEKLDIPLVASNNVHYRFREDIQLYKALQCRKWSNPNKDEDFLSDDFYLKSPEKMHEMFSLFPSAIENTLLIAGRCKCELPLNRIFLPAKMDYEKDLLPFFQKRLEYYFQSLQSAYADRMEYETRIKKELDIFIDTGMNRIFEILETIFYHSWENNGYLRLSGGAWISSLLAFLAGLHSIDPVIAGILPDRMEEFARSLSEPIILESDSLFHNQIMEFIENKYGKSTLCRVIRYFHYRPVEALKRCGDYLDIPKEKLKQIIDKIHSCDPLKKEKNLINLTRQFPDLKNLFRENEVNKKLLHLSSRLCGTIRGKSTHPSLYLFGSEEFQEYFPTEKNRNSERVSQLDQESLKGYHLLKLDIRHRHNWEAIGFLKREMNQGQTEPNLNILFQKVQERINLEGLRQGLIHSGDFLESFLVRAEKSLGALISVFGLNRLKKFQIAELNFILMSELYQKFCKKYEHSLTFLNGDCLFAEQVRAICQNEWGVSKYWTGEWIRLIQNQDFSGAESSRKIVLDSINRKRRRNSHELLVMLERIVSMNLDLPLASSDTVDYLEELWWKKFYPVEWDSACLTVNFRAGKKMNVLFQEYSDKGYLLKGITRESFDEKFLIKQSEIHFPKLMAVKKETLQLIEDYEYSNTVEKVKIIIENFCKRGISVDEIQNILRSGILCSRLLGTSVIDLLGIGKKTEKASSQMELLDQKFNNESCSELEKLISQFQWEMKKFGLSVFQEDFDEWNFLNTCDIFNQNQRVFPHWMYPKNNENGKKIFIGFFDEIVEDYHHNQVNNSLILKDFSGKNLKIPILQRQKWDESTPLVCFPQNRSPFFKPVILSELFCSEEISWEIVLHFSSMKFYDEKYNSIKELLKENSGELGIIFEFYSEKKRIRIKLGEEYKVKYSSDFCRIICQDELIENIYMEYSVNGNENG